MALIIVAFLIGEFSYDKVFPNIDRIGRILVNGNKTSLREDYRDFLLKNFPSVKDACRYNNYNATLTYGEKPITGQMIVTDSSFFSIFSMHFIVGSIHSSLSGPDDVVLTESFAQKLFGNEYPVGKRLVAEHWCPLTVSAVVKDLPKYSSIQGDFFTNSVNKIIYEGTTVGSEKPVAFFRLFVLLNDSRNMRTLENSIKENPFLPAGTFLPGDTGRQSTIQIRVVPFERSYLTQGLERSQTLHINAKLMRLLTITSLAIILLAVFNYINLTTAVYSGRNREIAIKKSFGASRGQVFAQFLSESFFMCTFSFLLALFMSTLWIPFFESFLGSKIELTNLYRPFWMVRLLLGVIVISILSGLYPALIVSRLDPCQIFTKHRIPVKGKLSLKAVLNIFQNVVSIILIISMIILSKQISFVKTRNLGFDTDNLLRVDVHWQLADKAKVIRESMLSDPAIKSVCFTHGSPGSIYLSSNWDALGGKNELIQILTADSTVFKVFHIQILKGREPLLSDFNKVCYLNEAAYKKTGWDTFEGKKFFEFEIIGVIRDFNYSDLHSPIGPLAVTLSSGMGVSFMTLRTPPDDLQGTIKILRETWKNVCPGYELRYTFYDDWLNSMYQNEERLAAAIRLFSVLAIIISCMGIFGIAEYSIKRKTREIGIRKVYGSGTFDVIVLLIRNILNWMLISLIIAVPIAWLLMNSWLKNFAYRMNLSWWIFFTGGAIAVVIALLTVSWQSYRAATRNPADTLRYE